MLILCYQKEGILKYFFTLSSNNVSLLVFRLHPNAVPTVGDGYFELEVLEDEIDTSKTCSTETSEQPDRSMFSDQCEESDQTDQTKFHGTSGNSEDSKSFEFIKLNDFVPYDDSTEISYKQMYEAEKWQRIKVESENKILKTKLRASDRKSKWRLQSIIAKKKRIIALSSALNLERKSNKESKQLADIVRSNKILHNSLTNSRKKRQGRRYNDETKKFAMGTYLAGPAAYRSIQQSDVLALPHKMTLGRWNADVQLTPGINHKILDILEQKTRNFSKREKAVLIAIDGMSIKAELTYNARTDTFMGFPSDGKLKRIEKNNPKILATEAVAIMVCGVSTLDPCRWSGNRTVGIRSKELRRFKQVFSFKF